MSGDFTAISCFRFLVIFTQNSGTYNGCVNCINTCKIQCKDIRLNDLLERG